jgi:hypothetical protein
MCGCVCTHGHRFVTYVEQAYMHTRLYTGDRHTHIHTYTHTALRPQGLNDRQDGYCTAEETAHSSIKGHRSAQRREAVQIRASEERNTATAGA